MNARSESEINDHVFSSAATIGHVLPNDHAEFVTGVIPAQRFNFDVLSDHITANFLGILNVKNHCFFAGCV